MRETLSAAELQSVDRSARTVKARIYSGASIPRRSLDGEYLLDLDAGGVDTSRAAAGSMPLLLDHSDRSESQVGRVVRVWRQGRELFADLIFGDSDLARQIFEDVAAGIRRGVSVGLSVLDSREEFDGSGGRHVVVTKSELVEVSIVPIPADGAAVMLAFNPEPSEVIMSTSPTLQLGAEAERNRVSEILGLAEKLKGQLPDGFATKFISDGSNVEKFRAAALDHLAAKDEAVSTVPQHSVMHDYRDKVADGIAAGLYSRATGKAPSDSGRPYVSMSLLDLARVYLRSIGVSDTAMPGDPMRLAGGALGLVNFGMGGLHTTSDFPSILGNTVGRVLMDVYQTAPAALKVICKKRTANDFRTLQPVRLGEYPTLQEVKQHGEFTYGPISEEAESYAVKTYGRIIGLTRQAIVNDDLSAFSLLPRAAAQACTQLEAQTLVNLLTLNSGAGPTMSDAVALFNAAHGNVAGSGGAISDSTLGAARLAMRSQKGVDASTLIDVKPAFLIVPAALETTAQKYLAQLQPAQASNVNPFSGALQLIVEPRLDAFSITRWYVAADPAYVPSLEYAHLAGSEGPHVETRIGWELDGIEMKVRLDFGAGAIDWRGLYSNAG